MNSRKIRASIPFLDQMVGRFMPGFEIMRAHTGESSAVYGRQTWQAILLNENKGWIICLIVESNPNGYCCVFMPASPGMASGRVKIYPIESMEYVQIKASDARKYLLRFGAGAISELNDPVGGKKV